ncbi:shikimate kinase [Desulfatibacillum alkenivorans DSM 16219]|jgi:shikimate kinase|uniref:Shikimate kinase n=1 Tax=Desulfatibacillum alkenivorans DSM 16219 TaxID=1121393 RepID=A0A1M6F278_9BACT|nr:shikimate kinase [Desulfatibacillum alkenivorans]SHI91792.1 shikimate kinase [Desulfatibacillum alkenivorans DSM 16219]
MEPKRNVVLIGMPAVGKSTIGVLLAKSLGFSFVDTDIIIQAGEGVTLQEIIDTKGLTFFREVEERYICGLEHHCHVIATGGSAVYSPKAMAHLAENGVIVHLRIDLESLEQRLADIGNRGVVMDPGQSIADLYAARRPLYLKYGQVAVECQSLTPDQIVGRIIQALDENPGILKPDTEC